MSKLTDYLWRHGGRQTLDACTGGREDRAAEARVADRHEARIQRQMAERAQRSEDTRRQRERE